MDKDSMKKIMFIITMIDIFIIIVFLKVLSINDASISKNSSKGVERKMSIVKESSQIDQVITSSQVLRMENDFQGTMEDNVLDLYRKRVVGIWHISRGMTFKFTEDGSYSGFFDNTLNDVSNYTYQCAIDEEGNPILHIYNEEKTAMVSYYLSLNDVNNVVLHFEAADIDIELKKEKQ